MQPNNPYGSVPPGPAGPQSYPKVKAKHHINWWMISFILTLLLFFGAVGFAVWAFMGRQDYKTNSDKKVATAVEIAKKQTASSKDNEFVAREKLPLKDYKGPSEYGSLIIKYPKTWGAYVNEVAGNSSLPVDAYFHPGFVPGLQSGTGFALRVQVIASPYDVELKKFDTYVKLGKATVTPYKAALVAAVSGSRIDGQIDNSKVGSAVLFPLRDKTLKIFTEANQFVPDFNTNILPNITFVP